MKKYLIVIILLTSFVSKGNYWTQKADFGGGSRLNAVSFSINGFGYVGTGTDTVAGLYIQNKDFWKYDPITDSWTQIADVGNTGLSGTIGFSIGNYGYVGLGNSNYFWRYNPAFNSWSSIAPFPGTSQRLWSSAVTVNNRAYVGLGSAFTAGIVYNDWYEYNPVTDSWLIKATFPGAARSGACEFSANGNVYVGGGSNSPSQPYMDYWKYDPVSNIWSSIGNCPAGIHTYSTSFSIGNNGFILIGWTAAWSSYNSLWKYDPFSNNWMVADSFPGTIRNFSTSFTIGLNAYICTGDHPTGGYSYPLKDLWGYYADSTTNIQSIVNSEKVVSISPNPFANYFEVHINNSKESEFILYDCTSRKLIRQRFVNMLSLNTEHLKNGIYFYEVKNEKMICKSGKIIKQ